MKYLLVLVMVLCAATLFAASGDYISPTADYDEGDWTSTNLVYASDNSRASNSGTSQHRVGGKTFGFDLPTGATLDSITAKVEGSSSGNAANRGLAVQLSKDGGATGVGDIVSFVLPTTLSGETVTTVRGSTNGLWNTTWTEAEVESANFTVDCRKSSTSALAVYQIDHIQVAFWYTTPGGFSGNRRSKIINMGLTNPK